MPAARAKTQAAKVTIKWEDLEDLDESKNILIVGDSGAGKTVLSGGAPNLLFLALENGTISAKRQGSKAKVVRILDWNTLEEKLDEIDAALEAGDKTFKWLCVDSLPKMQQMLRQNLLDTGMKEGRKGASRDSLQLQDYNEWYNKFLRFVDRLIDMPINVIFTSTSMRIEAEDDEGLPQDIVLPAIEGKAKEGYKLAQSVCAAMSSVWFLNIEGKGERRNRVLYTQRRPPYFAKCRYGVLPARLVLAPNDITTMARLLEKIDSGDIIPEETPEPEEIEEVEEEGLDDELADALEETTPKPAPQRSRVRRPGATKPKQAEPVPEVDEDEEEFELEDEDEEPAPEPRKPVTRRTAPKAAAKPAPAKPATRRAKSKAEPEPEEDFDPEEDLDDEDDQY